VSTESIRPGGDSDPAREPGSCPLCGTAVEAGTPRCPECGFFLAGSPGRRVLDRRGVAWLALVIAIVYVVALVVVAVSR
jgi:predicted nucleic acid-binding Zn ribbon protein